MTEPATSIVPQPILIVGYTMRMLAELAVRAGYRVTALDYFGDSDLQAMCSSLSLLRNFGGEAYTPAALTRAAREIAAPAVVYSTSFEHHPALVAQLAEGRQLLGNPPDVLARVRDPFQLASALRAGGFLFPETIQPGPSVTLDATRRWLWKPLNSGGGSGVRRVTSGSSTSIETNRPGIFQERLSGMVGSAAFVADRQRAVVLGLTEQLAGRRAFGASGFQYCGNLVPPRLPPDELAELLRQARTLADHLTVTFGLCGVNGIDFIWRERKLWTLEVNPRPSASLELIDALYAIRVFDAHVQSFRGRLPEFDPAAVSNEAAMGKAILFATGDVQVGDTRDWFEQNIRDVPHPGESIERSHPICTLLATGRTSPACLRALRVKADEVRSRLIKTKETGKS